MFRKKLALKITIFILLTYSKGSFISDIIHIT